MSGANRDWKARQSRSAPAPRGLADEARHKLQSALDELILCRGIIEGALARN